VEAVTGKITIKCKCGGKWSNGISGFKTHEDGGKHKEHFPPDSWEGLYSAAANRADQPQPESTGLATVERGFENAGARVADQSLEAGGPAANDGTEAEDGETGLTYINAGGMAGFLDAGDMADMAEESDRLDQIDAALHSQAVLPAPSIRRPIGLGLIIPQGWFTAEQLASCPSENPQ
jgi:hypothetical protein